MAGDMTFQRFTDCISASLARTRDIPYTPPDSVPLGKGVTVQIFLDNLWENLSRTRQADEVTI